jgi:hypothetical protein
LCVGWPGVKDRLFQPDEEIRLQYRIWIHNGAATVPQLENAYKLYNSQSKINEKKHTEDTDLKD